LFAILLQQPVDTFDFIRVPGQIKGELLYL
jgi:hypothetical protein